jgi:multiple sugar transport system ATP-binding protein
MDAYPIASDDIREAVDDDDVFAKIQEAAREGGSTFTARLEPSPGPKVGESLEVAFRTAKLHFFDLQSGHALR